MGIKKFRPTTDALRWTAISNFDELTKSRPEKKLLVPLKKTGGRNNRGRVTSRHRGGGHKRMIRVIDFKRDKLDIPAKVIAIEYDPNRSARLALVQYADSEKRYIIAPVGLQVNDEVIAGKSAEIKVGNSVPLENIPAGIPIHNVELRRGSGANIARAAGNA
nr:50S ribosomal protein L2 [Candidatus Omnitrophota bacterium]